MKTWQILLPVAVSLGYQLAGVAAAEHSATPPRTTASQQAVPIIRFLRPIRGEHFFDYPIFLQVDVTGFHLVPPEKQHTKTPPPNSGYIRYSMDDYPVYASDDTQVMIGKFLGSRYIPVGWHKVKAELVDVNGAPLNPPVVAETAAFSGHPALVETDHVQTGSMNAELNAQELYKMRLQLQEMQKELIRMRTGSAGYVPVPTSENEHHGE